MTEVSKTALVILAHGFEEVEAVSAIDLLRRAKVQVTVAGLAYPVVTSSREVRVIADTELKEVSTKKFDMIVLPGGEPGTTYLEASECLRRILLDHFNDHKYIGAICAAPRILNNLGLLTGKKATCYPGIAEAMTRCEYTPESVVVDGRLITGQGAGASIEWALTLVRELVSEDVSETLRKTICASPLL
jgi:4-methyl-5(b-hydroxyethyl)-thiazole monophosphate biosynthesis